ncbi:MAG: TonB family protein [Bacteroidota bacterium]
MSLRRSRFPTERDPHVATRTLAGTALALALALTLVMWPGRAAEPKAVFHTEREILPVELVEVPQTTVAPPPAALAPPPPPPSDLDIPPVEVEDLIEVEEFEVTPFEVRETTPRPAPPGPPAPPVPPGPPRSGPPGTTPATSGAQGDGPVLVRNPDTLPRNRMVRWPEYPDAARRAGVEGRAVVEILVTEGGRVESFEIVERFVIDRRGREERVAQLPHGMEASVAEAVQRRVYSPARHGGRIVRTYTRETIRIGVQ